MFKYLKNLWESIFGGRPSETYETKDEGNKEEEIPFVGIDDLIDTSQTLEMNIFDFGDTLHSYCTEHDIQVNGSPISKAHALFMSINLLNEQSGNVCIVDWSDQDVNLLYDVYLIDDAMKDLEIVKTDIDHNYFFDEAKPINDFLSNNNLKMVHYVEMADEDHRQFIKLQNGVYKNLIKTEYLIQVGLDNEFVYFVKFKPVTLVLSSKDDATKADLIHKSAYPHIMAQPDTWNEITRYENNNPIKEALSLIFQNVSNDPCVEYNAFDVKTLMFCGIGGIVGGLGAQQTLKQWIAR